MKPPFTSHQQLREHYQAEMAIMRQSFERTGNGVLCIRRRALVVDNLLEPLWQFEPRTRVILPKFPCATWSLARCIQRG